MDLDELLLALRRGEPRASERFGLAVRDELYRFFSNCFGPVDADELTQDAFIVVWEKLDQFEPHAPGHVVRWLFTIAANKARARREAPIRQIARHDKVREHQAIDSPMTGPETRVRQREQQEIFERCKDQLDDDEQRILDHTFAGGNDRQLARAEDIKTASVRSRRHRAKRTMRELVEAERKTPDAQRSPPPS